MNSLIESLIKIIGSQVTDLIHLTADIKSLSANGNEFRVIPTAVFIWPRSESAPLTSMGDVCAVYVCGAICVVLMLSTRTILNRNLTHQAPRAKQDSDYLCHPWAKLSQARIQAELMPMWG